MAAEILLGRLLVDPQGTSAERDTLILPILFLFRHYVELRLKDIIVYGQVVTGQPARWRQGHPLQQLWTEARTLCTAVYGSAMAADLARVDACVSDLDLLDPNSEHFRYPRDKGGRPLFEHVVIGLERLSATIAHTANSLDGIAMDMSVRSQGP